jgi:hypothetical protein
VPCVDVFPFCISLRDNIGMLMQSLSKLAQSFLSLADFLYAHAIVRMPAHDVAAALQSSLLLCRAPHTCQGKLNVGSRLSLSQIRRGAGDVRDWSTTCQAPS